METFLNQTELNEFGTMTRTTTFSSGSSIITSVGIPLTGGGDIRRGTDTTVYGDDNGVSLMVIKTRLVDGERDEENSSVTTVHFPVEHARALAALLIAAADKAGA